MSEKHREVQRGEEAAQVLDNPAFQDAMDDLKRSAVDHWRECSLADAEAQRLALMLMKVTEKFESLLRGRIEKGKFARHLLEQEKDRGKAQVRRAMRGIG